MFKSYRAKELANVPAISTMRLKVIGEGGETKWLAISSNELEKIIAVLEPKDYADVMRAAGLPSILDS
jgi:hypothetical protein